MRSVPLRVSFLGPVLRLACLGGGGGRPSPVSPLPGLGLCAPRVVRLRVWGVPAPGGGMGGVGGAACAPCPPTVLPGGAVGRGVALPQSFPLPSLGRHQSGCPWRRSGHGGRGPHTAPVRARLLSPGAVRVAPWRVGAGSLSFSWFLRGQAAGAWGRALLRPPSRAPRSCRGEGRSSPLPRGGWGPAPLWLAGRWGGVGGQGGGRAVAPLLSLWGGRSGAPYPAPLSLPAHSPEAYAFGRGCGAAPCAGCVLLPAGQPGLGGGGRPVNPPSGGSDRPGPSLCPP